MRDGKREENEMMSAHENSRNQDLLSRWEAMRERFAAHLRSRGWSTADESAREILKSVDCDDESVQDYARRTDITPNSASVRLFRARKALREKLLDACHTTSAAECMTCDCDV